MTTAQALPAPAGTLDRALRLFTDVRDGEGAQALLLAFNIFLILSAYYVMKPVREALILAQPGGAEIKSYAMAVQAVRLIIEAPPAAPRGPRFVSPDRDATKPKLLRWALSAASAATKAKLLAEIPDGANAWQMIVSSILLESNGQREEALNTLRSAFQQQPSDVSIRQAYADRLVADGRYAEIIDAFSIGLSDNQFTDNPAKSAVRAAGGSRAAIALVAWLWPNRPPTPPPTPSASTPRHWS